MGEQYKIDLNFKIDNEEATKLLFNTIIHYNGRGGTNQTASKFMLQSFNNYDPSITKSLLNSIENQYRARKLLDKYNITSKEDFTNILEETKFEHPNLTEPYHRLLVLDTNMPGAAALKETLSDKSMKDRALLLLNHVHQNVILTQNDYYFSLLCDNFMYRLSRLYKKAKSQKSESLITAVNAILDSTLQYLASSTEDSITALKQEDNTAKISNKLMEDEQMAKLIALSKLSGKPIQLETL